MRIILHRTIVFWIVLTLVSTVGCASKKEADELEVIAKVNGEEICLKDLKREIAIRLRQDPSLELDDSALNEMTDTLIKRRIIIQEAAKKNMAQEPRFVDTIKTFWEQTLIREFIEYKNTEFEGYVSVTDEEIKDFYANIKSEDLETPPFDDIRGQIKGQLKLIKKARAFTDWLEKKKKDSDVVVYKEAISKRLLK